MFLCAHSIPIFFYLSVTDLYHVVLGDLCKEGRPDVGLPDLELHAEVPNQHYTLHTVLAGPPDT